MNSHSPGEEEFLKNYDASLYEKISVAVDLLTFTVEDDCLKILMVRRGEHPFAGCLALPGVFVGRGETLDEAAMRGVLEETGLSGIYYEQLYTWGDLERDPRTRVISVSYMNLVSRDQLSFRAGQRTTEAVLLPVRELLDSGEEIAFDHRRIIEYALWRLRNKVEYTDIAFHLVPEEFTLPELQRVYEIILGRPLFKANFRKKVAPMIEETDRYTAGEAHRPSRYYRRRENETQAL